MRLSLERARWPRASKSATASRINGCCLTVTGIDGPQLGFDLLEETARADQPAPGQTGRVGESRARAAANGRYGGHFVSGHIDTTGTIRVWEKTGGDYELRIGIDPAHGSYLVPKGCIAVDGISLTVADVGRDEFSVWIIPHTREVTALRDAPWATPSTWSSTCWPSTPRKSSRRAPTRVEEKLNRARLAHTSCGRCFAGFIHLPMS